MRSVKTSRWVLALAGTVVFGLAARPAPAPPEQASVQAEKDAVAKVINDNICWALTKDRALAESTMAHDEDLFYFWTASNFTVRGWKQHAKYFDMWMDPRFRAVRTEVRDLHVYLSRSGDVAWYDATLDDVVEWDGKLGGGENIRWTGVLEKREGKWVVVHMHASLAADKVRESVLKAGK